MVSAISVSDVQLKRFAAWMLMLAALVVCVLMPDLAFAQSAGEGSLFGSGADSIKEGSEASFRAWWEVGSTWMLWIGLVVLAATVIFFKGQGWYVALIIWAIAAWGDKVVDWVGLL